MSHCHSQSNECGCCSHKTQGTCCSKQSSCACGSCSSGNACSSCGCKQNCDYAQKFLELADHAWMELLKEKVKEHTARLSPHMDELARLIAESNHERWKKKMENESCSDGFQEKLNQFFGKSCPKK